MSGFSATDDISIANAAGSITIDQPVQSSGGGAITLIADAMTVDAAVESSGILTVAPTSAAS
ncbi:MAG: hypothetical protein ACLQVN_27175, partial [Bryobacteraceae bacterium]